MCKIGLKVQSLIEDIQPFADYQVQVMFIIVVRSMDMLHTNKIIQKISMICGIVVISVVYMQIKIITVDKSSEKLVKKLE